jgi:hypothetical protein
VTENGSDNLWSQRAVARFAANNYFKSTTCKAVRVVADAFMKPINSATGKRHQNASRRLVTDFWTEIYLPWCVEKLRASTVKNYQQTWTLYMEDHFQGRTLVDYRPSDAGSDQRTSRPSALTVLTADSQLLG